MNQGNSGGYFSCIEQIGIGGFPRVISSFKTDHFPSAKHQHIK